MPKITRVDLICDNCEDVIDTDAYYSYVDAQVYGAVFHRECWTAVGGPKVARLLGLDDIDIRNTKTAEVIEKAWGPRK